MPVRRLCSFSLPTDARGREFFTDCVKPPFHGGRHVVGTSGGGGAALHEVDEERRTLSMVLHARLNPGQNSLAREEMGALLVYTDLLSETRKP